jgi:signal transduction histidine kinase
MIGEMGFALENAQLHDKVKEQLKSIQKRSAELIEANARLEKEISDRERAEEGLRKAAALETLSSVLENFISDSLGNLLTPVYSGIELCQMSDSVDQIKDELRIIKQGITELLRGINVYRKFAKAREPSLGMISWVDLRSILGPLLSGQALETYGGKPFLVDSNLKLGFVYDPKEEGALNWEELPPVSGSKVAITAALSETLINALESYDDPRKGGVVTLSAKKDKDNLILDISDKGKGMSSDAKDKCQLPFYKILGIKKSARLGLGAYIAHEAAKFCGGDVQIESTEGVGTTVSILLKISD